MIDFSPPCFTPTWFARIRRARRTRQNKIEEVAESQGYRRCGPCIWIHDGLQIHALVRGDDFQFSSDRTGIEKSKKHWGKALRLENTELLGLEHELCAGGAHSENMYPSDFAWLRVRSGSTSRRSSVLSDRAASGVEMIVGNTTP